MAWHGGMKRNGEAEMTASGKRHHLLRAQHNKHALARAM